MKYKIFDLEFNADDAQQQLNDLLKDGWKVVCSVGGVAGRIILRNFDDSGNVTEWKER